MSTSILESGDGVNGSAREEQNIWIVCTLLTASRGRQFEQLRVCRFLNWVDQLAVLWARVYAFVMKERELSMS